MKLKTRWKRVKHLNILGKRFFDGGEYGLGYFTILKAYKCYEYCDCAYYTLDSQWFPKAMIVIKTDTGIVYRIPFFPWMKVYEAKTDKKLSDYFDECPWY